MPVGTQATVKAQTVDDMNTVGSQVLLANTYHLLLRPGPEVFKHFGGIHRFMNWPKPVLTDSGGFQIFSLPETRSLNEKGARFVSYVDRKECLLSPESSIEMQKAIGSDIMMVLDQCIPSTAPHAEALAAMQLTHRWAERCLRARGDSSQALFGIVQGALHHDLRKRSAEFLRELPFDGLAIGGLAVGETHAQRYEFTGLVAGHLPGDRPRYLMGVGTPIDILEAVHRGVDMFDCILPSQVAQRGTVFTAKGKIQLRRSVYKFSEARLDPDCDCRTCREYSRGYLHHLTKTEEVLGWQLLTQHNLTFYHRMMREMRSAILNDTFVEYYERARIDFLGTDEENPMNHPERKRFPKSRHLGDYEIVSSPEGFSNIRQRSSGETMHSVSAPSEEADRLYIQQSRLADKLNGEPASDELTIWDVGLGAASNAMAAVHCFERLCAVNDAAKLRPLRIVSFERDLDPLRLAAKFASHFPHLRHGAPTEILEKGSWIHASGKLRWHLIEGDFLEQIEKAPAPDVIFYDPFSSKTDTTLWTSDVFARVHARTRGRGVELYTYSAATRVRVMLLRAGFVVAAGVGTGPKADTTIGFSDLATARAHPSWPNRLGAEWLMRWRRSGSKFPPELPAEQQAGFAAWIESRPQFAAEVALS
jgi:queuine tRNA-ribosyltransferase